jgi:hypothetical protein
MKLIAGLGVVLMTFAGPIFGQEAISVTGSPLKSTGTASEREQLKITRASMLRFDNESEKSEVKINMTADYNLLQLQIVGNFESGKVTLELIDPKGEKRGSFNLKTDDPIVVKGKNTTSKDMVSGNLNKEFQNPLPGEWIIRAIPVNATGSINISITQEYQPATIAPAATVIGQPLKPKKDR